MMMRVFKRVVKPWQGSASSKMAAALTGGNASAIVESLEPRRLLAASVVPAAPPVVNITAFRPAASETSGSTTGKGQFIVERTGPITDPLVVRYYLRGGSTATPADYRTLSGTVTILAGRYRAAIDIKPVDDSLGEGPERVILNLNTGSYTIDPKRKAAIVTIADNEPTINVTVLRPNASETDGSVSGKGQFIVERTLPIAAPLVVNYEIAGGSTAATNDYEALSGSVTILAGKYRAAVNISPIDDGADEDSETVILNLTAGAYSIDPIKNTATVTIADNEPAINVTVLQPNASETDGSVTGKGLLIVERTTPIAAPLVVNYEISSSSTAATNDYEALSGSVTILAGKYRAAVNIRPIDDGADEDSETVILNLTAGSYSIDPIKNTATVTIADNDEPAADWWDDGWHFRSEMSFNANSFARTDKAVERGINFTTELSAAGGSGTFIEDSLRVIEVDAGNNILDAAVPFQFDKADGYDASSNASGNLVILMKDDTSADEERFYHIYFDSAGAFSPATFSALVTPTDGLSDEGQTAIRIANQTAIYYLQKENGGFSSIVDTEGNDWTSFNATPGSGSGGEYRGLPNAIYPGGGFHAGGTGGTTTIMNTGPLKTTIETEQSVDQGSGAQTWKIRYEFYPTYVVATLLQTPGNYWFLYEGTPGGGIDGSDFVMRSDGTQTSIDTTWDDGDGLGSGNGAEWAYFADGNADRYLFAVHNELDGIEDSYYLLDNNMTVFGFGRQNVPGNTFSLLTQPSSFTFGLADDPALAAATANIDASYRSYGTSAIVSRSRD